LQDKEYVETTTFVEAADKPHFTSLGFDDAE
jgi:hypothetical protein